MSKVKKHIAAKQNNSVKKSENIVESRPLVSFNFKYLTDNKKFNFDYFKDMRIRHDAYKTLCDRLQELSAYDVMTLRGMSKQQGCEAIPYSDFNDSFQAVLNKVEIVSKDSKLLIFRFNKGNYRIIVKSGILDKHENILHIIGFDFDYSAYDHGS